MFVPLELGRFFDVFWVRVFVLPLELMLSCLVVQISFVVVYNLVLKVQFML